MNAKLRTAFFLISAFATAPLSAALVIDFENLPLSSESDPSYWATAYTLPRTWTPEPVSGFSFSPDWTVQWANPYPDAQQYYGKIVMADGSKAYSQQEYGGGGAYRLKQTNDEPFTLESFKFVDGRASNNGDGIALTVTGYDNLSSNTPLFTQSFTHFDASRVSTFTLSPENQDISVAYIKISPTESGKIDNISVVPEPSTYVLITAGIMAAFVFVRRKLK